MPKTHISLHMLWLLCALWITGCKQTADPAEPDPTPDPLAQVQAPQPPPQAVEGYDWRLWVDEKGSDRRAFLFYAPQDRDVDQAVLKFLCIEGESDVYAGIGVRDEADELELNSNNHPLILKVSSNGEWLTSEKFSITSPFMQEFVKNGWLTMTLSVSTDGLSAGSRTDAASSTPQGLRAVADFVQHCHPGQRPAPVTP